MALACSSARSTGTATALSTALTEFQASLSDERKARLLALRSVPRATDVLAFTAELDRANAARKRRGVASRFCTLLESIQQYAAVMDTYSQVKADTTSLIWGSLKLCIHVASSAVSYYDKLSEWFMRLGALCPRLSLWQSLFPHDARLQRALDAFYATVIRFCTRAVQVLDRTGIMNFLSTLWKPFELEFASLEKDLKRKRAKIDDEIRLAAAQDAIRERNNAIQERTDASRFRDSISKNFTIWRSADEARNKELDAAKLVTEKQRLLDRLSSYDYTSALKENRKKRHGSTCSWLMAQSDYNKWRLYPRSSIMWLTGSVGSGKSVLSASVVDDLLRHNVQGSAGVAFFFCKENDAESVLATTILRSLIRQCLPTADSLPELNRARLASFFSEEGNAPEASNTTLTELFVAALSRVESTFVLIDGLDECPVVEQRAFLRVLNDIPAVLSASRLKIFLASGDDVGKNALTAFSSRYHVSMNRKHVDTDIATYVKETMQMKISQGELLVGNPELLGEVQRALVDGANGMFLWVAFQIQDICEQSCDDDIRRVITTLPKGLRETYERLLQRIDKRGCADVAEKVLRWTAAVRRPLTVDELHEAIAVEPGQESFRRDRLANGFEARVVTWCGHLVTLDEESRAMQFTHPTVKQYLLSDTAAAAKPAEVARFHFRPDEAATEVGEVCVTYLCLSDFDQRLVQMSKLDLSVDPTALAATSLAASGSTSIAKGLERFERWRKKSLVPAAAGAAAAAPAAPKLDKLVMAADFQRLERAQAAQKQHPFAFLAYASDHWLAHTSRLTDQARMWPRFLRLVLESDQFGGLGSRLDSGHDMQRLARDIVELDHTALLSTLRRFRPRALAAQLDLIFQVCCEKRLKDLAMICLDIAEEVEQLHDEWLLHTAAWDAPDLTKRLLDMGAVIDTRNDVANTPLDVAVLRGNSKVVEVLLAKGALACESSSQSALFRVATEHDKVDIVEMLLDAGAKLDALAQASASSLVRRVAGSGSIKLVEKLVIAGARIPRIKHRRDGSTLLIAALEGRCFELVERLISQGADVNLAALGDKRTALQAAARVGSTETVKSLLKAGANINAVPDRRGGKTAIHTAVLHGNHEVVELLLEAGAEVRRSSPVTLDYKTITTFAASRRLDLIEKLVEAGAVVPRDGVSSRGASLLVAAIEGRHFQLASYLIDSGADVNRPLYLLERSRYGRTALNAAVETRNILLIDRLIEAGAHVNAWIPDGRRRTALHTAVNGGDLGVIETLLGARARVNGTPMIGPAAWKNIAASGRLDLVEKLFNAGFQIPWNETWRDGATVLIDAVVERRFHLAWKLIEAGADLNTPAYEKGGRTVLQAAAGTGDEQMVRFLINMGADANAKPAQYGGRTALQAAAEAGNVAVAELLLRAGADVHATPASDSGTTALQAAAASGVPDMVTLLVRAVAGT